MMAEPSRTSRKDFNLTKSEVDKLQNALKDENFVKLLTDYARELSDPAKKAEYEREISELERQRGYDVSFIHPKPGYVIKVEEKDTRKKIFINICSEAQIGAPASVSTSQAGQTGLKWSIPYSLSKPRDDLDRSGGGCVVYDAIFHPDTLYLASRDARIKNLVHNTAFDALKTTFNVIVDTQNIKYPKLKFKGVFHPTVIRKARDSSKKSSTEENSLDFVEKAVTITPTFSIKYRNSTDLQDYILQSNTVSSSRPKEMVIDIELPKLDSAANLDLDVQERFLSLVRDTPPCHKLNIELPFPVDENNGNAKFDKSRKSLVVTLPIKPGAPVMKTERLSSNDSGIEMEESNGGGVANNNAEGGHGHNDISKKASSANSDKTNGKQNGEKINKKEGYRTGGDNNNKKAKKAAVKTAAKSDDLVCDDAKESSSEREASPPAAADQMEVDSDNVIKQSKNDVDNTGDIDDSTNNKNQDDQITNNTNNNNHYRTKPGFLDSDVTYSLPTFTHTVLDNVMIVTLEVKNVSEETVAVARFDAWKSIHLKFSSVGAGYFPVQHAFYIDFLQVGSFAEEDINVECWDNNLVLQFPWSEAMSTFRVGTMASDLKDKEYTVQKSAKMELSLNSEDTKSNKSKKYTHEKHPKLIKKDSPQKKAKESENCQPSGDMPSSSSPSPSPTGTSKDSAPTSGPTTCTMATIRERHSSGEDSSMSMSPYDTILLEQQHLKHLQSLQEEQRETAAESDGDDPHLLLKRSISTEEGMLRANAVVKPRSILKRKSMPTLVGSRFRCYSESCVDNVGSAGQLSAGVSESTISEESETLSKKTVRFNEKIQQQLYRVNSCIIAKTAKNKKKAENKKRRAVERRLSESDSVDLKASSSGGAASTSNSRPAVPKTGSLDSNTWEQESHEDSGLSSSFEETVVISEGGGDGAGSSTGDQQGQSKQKTKKRTKKRTKTFEMTNDLIFDLDI